MPSDPQRSKARKQLRTRDAIPLDEVEADFGMKGMLSFLQVPREEASRNLEARRAVDIARDTPMGESPLGDNSNVLDITRGYVNTPAESDTISAGHLHIGSLQQPQEKKIEAEAPKRPPIAQSATDHPLITRARAQTNTDLGDFTYSVAIPDVGKRKPFRWTLAQDAHTASEQTLFAAMMELSRKQGAKLPDGSSLVEASLTDLQKRLRTDHKQIKKLLANLIEKHAIAVERPANPARQIPAKYRVFSFQQINEKRRSLGLLWVVKNRGVRLLSDDFVQQLLVDLPMGYSPLGVSAESSEQPMGKQRDKPMGYLPEEPMGRTPGHILIEESRLRTDKNPSTATPPDFLSKLRDLFEGDCDVQLADRVWKQGREVAPDITVDELMYFATNVYLKAKQNPRVHRPQSIVVTTIGGHLRDGGLQRIREQILVQQRRADRDREDTIEFWKGIANNPMETPESRLQAQNILRDYGISLE
jgi:hypothetical protein